jgi:hypothetical protein
MVLEVPKDEQDGKVKEYQRLAFALHVSARKSAN